LATAPRVPLSKVEFLQVIKGSVEATKVNNEKELRAQVERLQ